MLVATNPWIVNLQYPAPHFSPALSVTRSYHGEWRTIIIQFKVMTAVVCVACCWCRLLIRIVGLRTPTLKTPNSLSMLRMQSLFHSLRNVHSVPNWMRGQFCLIYIWTRSFDAMVYWDSRTQRILEGVKFRIHTQKAQLNVFFNILNLKKIKNGLAILVVSGRMITDLYSGIRLFSSNQIDSKKQEDIYVQILEISTNNFKCT